MRPLLKWATPVLLVVNVGLVLTGVLALRDAVVVMVLMEMLLVLAAAGTALAGVRSFRRGRATGATTWPAFVTTVHEVLPRPLAVAVIFEATTLRSLWLALRRRDDGVASEDAAFGYAAGVGPVMGALTAVAVIELVVVHMLVPWPWVRILLLVLGLWSAIVVLGMWAGLCRHPHVVSAERLLLRAGPNVVIGIPWDRLKLLSHHLSHEPNAVKVIGQRLHLPVHGTTTLLAQLSEPVQVHLPFGRTAEVDNVAFTADDPTSLHTAITRAHAANAMPGTTLSSD